MCADFPYFDGLKSNFPLWAKHPATRRVFVSSVNKQNATYTLRSKHWPLRMPQCVVNVWWHGRRDSSQRQQKESKTIANKGGVSALFFYKEWHQKGALSPLLVRNLGVSTMFMQSMH
jgi:hypothetical protein